MGKSLLGKLGPEAVGMMELPRLPRDIVEGFRAVVDGAVRLCPKNSV